MEANIDNFEDLVDLTNRDRSSYFERGGSRYVSDHTAFRENGGECLSSMKHGRSTKQLVYSATYQHFGQTCMFDKKGGGGGGVPDPLEPPPPPGSAHVTKHARRYWSNVVRPG